MAARLELAPGFKLPLDAVTHTFGIFGQKGSGKSTTGAVMVEQMVHAGARAVVFDPTGVWHGLTREGREPGLPGVVLGGEHADAPLEAGSGALVAEFVIGTDYPLVVLDMKLMRKHVRQSFAMEFLEALYHDNRDPLMVVIDEAPQFAPQMGRGRGGGGDDAVLPRLLGAVEDVVSLGRSRGLGATLIAQRFAMVNANVREQIGTLVAHRLIGKLDRTALGGWIEVNGDPEREKEVLQVVAKLPDGQALVWSPAFLDYFGVVAMNNAATFDSRATPKVGQRRKALTKRMPVDLNALKERMAAVIEERDRNDPKKLRARVQELAKKLATETREPPEHEIVRRYFAPNKLPPLPEGFAWELGGWMGPTPEAPLPRILTPEPERVEVPVLTDKEADSLQHLAKAVEGLAEQGKFIADGAAELVGTITARVPDPVRTPPAVPPRLQTDAPATARVVAGKQSHGSTGDLATDQSESARKARVPVAPVPAHSGARSGPVAAADNGAFGGGSDLTGPEQRVLDAVYWYETLGIAQPTRIMVGFIAGYRVTKKGGGTFSNILSALKNGETPLIQYPGTGHVALTEEGRALARDPGIERTNEGVQRAVMARLDGPEQRTLANLIDAYPNAMTRIDLGTASGYTVTAKGGGTFSNILSRLRSLGLADYPSTGEVVATDILFPVRDFAYA
jgi:hypothetical protein